MSIDPVAREALIEKVYMLEHVFDMEEAAEIVDICIAALSTPIQSVGIPVSEVEAWLKVYEYSMPIAAGEYLSEIVTKHKVPA